MNETKQTAQQPDEMVTRTAFWGTLALSVIDFSMCSYLFTVLSQQPRTAITYAAMAIFTLAILTALTSFVLTLSRRQELAAKLLFCVIFIIGFSAVTLYRGRTLDASLSILLTAVMVIHWLFPSRAPRRRYLAFAVASFLLMWVIEWINPSWRTELETVTLGPTAVIGFGLVLGWIVFTQSRRFIVSSMRNKLVFAFVAITFLAVAAVGIVTNLIATAQIDILLGNNFHELASRMANETGKTIVNSKTAMDGLALNKFIQDSVEETNLAAISDLGELSRLDEEWRAAGDNDPLLTGVLNNEISGELHELQARLPQYAELFVTDRYGAVIASTNRTSDYYQADEEWWQQAWHSGAGQVFISQPVFDESAGTYAVDIALPIPAHNRSDVIGVLRATVNISELTSVLSANQFGETGQAVLLLPNHQYLTRETGNDLPTLDLETRSALGSFQTKYGEISYAGIESLVSKAPVTAVNDKDQKIIEQLNWTIVVHQSLSEAHAPVAATTRGVLFVALAVLIAAGLVALYAGRQFVKPVEDLTAAAEKFAKGDLYVKAAETSQDEIGKLANTFNLMTSQLRGTLANLEQRVADRTHNLELAAQVGRAVSQVRSLDVMLKDACDLILKEFDLYYVQVYLTDPSHTTLKLEAGTGNVGVQLLARGHSLPFDSSSINGRAAVEKTSVVISDTTQSATFRQNPLLPETRGEMAVPLIVANRVVGVLDMQSHEPGILNTEALPAFEALAGQLAVAIRNSTLLAEAEAARAEVEKQARRLVQTGWTEHLDAIHKPEQIGFVFDRKEVKPMVEGIDPHIPAEHKSVSAPLSITGEQLGSLVVEVEDESHKEQAIELTNAVARLVSQQIENVRLLESAERYRHEAERSARAQTLEGWQEFVASRSGESLSYLYDANEVRPQADSGPVDESMFDLPIKARNEMIGKLSVQGLTADDHESIELVNIVADRLSAHIENLRLFEQTQVSLAESQSLYRINEALSGETELGNIYQTVAQLSCDEMGFSGSWIAVYEPKTETIRGVAGVNLPEDRKSASLPISQNTPGTLAAQTRQVVTVNNPVQDERMSDIPQDVRAFMGKALSAPIMVGQELLGVIAVTRPEGTADIGAREERMLQAIAVQLAIVMQRIKLFEQVQRQAERESTLNAISQKIQSATTVEAVLQIAARELGHTLGAPLTIAQLGLKETASDN